MSTAQPLSKQQFDLATIMGGLYGDGIIGLKKAFSSDWVKALDEDITIAYQEALQRPGGVLDRGSYRHYSEIHPEAIRGFLDLVTHPWVICVCEKVLGPDYKIVELGFDIPNGGAVQQPWHRDFPAPKATLIDRHLNSLAFNLTTVNVSEEMGPLEVAPGTQWDEPSEFTDGMFPPPSSYSRYQERAVRKLTQMGDITARTALMIHRGTANRTNIPRPTLVLGVDAPDAINSERHDLQVTEAFFEKLPESVKQHLDYRIVNTLEPIAQVHTIGGLTTEGYQSSFENKS